MGDNIDWAAAGVNLVGGLLGYDAGKKDRDAQLAIAQKNYDAQIATNLANKQIAQENNQNSVYLMRENNAFNLQAMREANQWNSAPEVMKRAQAAGINPYVAAGQMSEGRGQMTSSAGTPTLQQPNLVAPHMDMVQGKYSRMAEMLSALSGSVVNLAQAKKLGADKKLIDNTMNDIIDNYRAQTRNLNASAESTEQQVNYFDLVKDVRADRERLERDYTKENIDNLKASTNKLREEINVLAEDVRLKVSQQKVNEKQVEVGDSQISVNAATIAHLANVDAQGWKQIEIGLANVAIGRYNAETQRYMAEHPNDFAAAMIQIGCGLFGVQSPEELGAAIGKWMGTNDNNTPGQSWTVPGIGKKFMRWYLEKSGVPEKYINKMSGAFHSVEKGIEDFFGGSDDKSERSPYDPPTRNVVKP